MIKKIILWALILVCMGTVFYFSAQVADVSGRISEGFTYKVIKFFDLKDSVSDERAMEIAVMLNGFVRKGAHFSVYALLGFLIALLLNEYRQIYRNTVILSVAFSSLYACSDELHQYFVPGRSAQFSDVLLDTFGALFGALIAVGIIILIKKRKEKNTAK